MIFRAEKISAEAWDNESAHLISFGEARPKELNSYHFILAAFDESNNIAGYSTCIEMDKESLYLQHGGIMPNYAKSVHVLQAYGKCIVWCQDNYKRITTKIENKNLSMLKIAMQVGFLVVGTSTFKDKVYLDLLLEGA